jgi:transposase
MGPFRDPTEEPSALTRISTIGLDIAKNSFAAHGYDAEGKMVLKKELTLPQVLPFSAELEP